MHYNYSIYAPASELEPLVMLLSIILPVLLGPIAFLLLSVICQKVDKVTSKKRKRDRRWLLWKKLQGFLR
jgi:hypothetical protein